MRRIKKILSFGLIAFIMLCLIPTNAHSYSTGISSVDDIRNNHVDIYQTITFNFTAIGGGSAMTMTITNKLDVDKPVIINGRATGGIGSEDRAELIPSVKSVWNQQPLSLIETVETQPFQFNYTETSYYVTQTYPHNNTVSYLNITGDQDIFNTEASKASYTGHKFEAVLLPARDVAADYCRRNGLIFNALVEENLTIDYDNGGISQLAIIKSENMTPDNNLADGYDGIPVSASAIVGLGQLVYLIVKAILIAVVVIAAIFALLDYKPFAKTIINNVNQDNYFPEYNATDDWNEYESIAIAANLTPTWEGYLAWLEQVGKSRPDTTATQNNNFSIPEDSGGGFTFLSGFFENLGPIIQMVIIIIIVIVAIALILRFLKFVKG
jgi:hypothetical protein